MRSTWIEVSCAVPDEIVDILADFLVELSGNGVSIENLSLDTFSLETVHHPQVKTVKAYFCGETSPAEISSAIDAFIAGKKAAFPEFPFEPPVMTTLREEDWANNWKEHFKPSRIGRHLVIKPTWEAFAATGSDIIIELDPGMAFGTGTHATTRLCLESLEKIFTREPPFDQLAQVIPKAVLDVGTGSGVLSITAAKLGATRVVAVDIDPDAVVVARENLAMNHITADVTVAATPLQDIPGLFHIVVANIIAEELVKLSPDLFSKLEPGALLILSGILTEREQYVREGFGHLRLSLVEITRREEWSCLTYCRER